MAKLIIANSDHHTLSTFAPAQSVAMANNILVCYHYFEGSAYRGNFEYFIRHGILPSCEYIICINGGCSLDLPLFPNVRYLYRPNVGFDFGAYDEAIRSIDIDQFGHFFFINCTMRGPFLPPYFSAPWTAPFLDLLSDDVKLVGPTINVLHRNATYAAHFRQKYSFREPFSHVQSMMFATDRECLGFLKRKGFFDQGNERTHDDVIIKHEILMSQEVLANGWNISSILPEYRSLNYRVIDQDINPSSHLGDPWYRSRYFHRTLHPFETIFFKTNRNIADMADLDQLGRSQRQAPSDDICRRDTRLKQIASAWKGHKNFAIWLASRLQAETIVDLGVDYGFSTFCFGLAATGQVYGIDSFEGDPQTGFRDTYKSVCQGLEELGLRNVTIIPGHFDAVGQTWQRPIDILHIDGNHSHEAVKADYLTWSKFVKHSGVVLFHNTCVSCFGVRRFFDEIALPKVNLSNSHGLGIVSHDRDLIHEIATTFDCLIEAGSLQLDHDPRVLEALDKVGSVL
jgi:predicted O-methyltransferase YrrM